MNVASMFIDGSFWLCPPLARAWRLSRASFVMTLIPVMKPSPSCPDSLLKDPLPNTIPCEWGIHPGNLRRYVGSHQPCPGENSMWKLRLYPESHHAGSDGVGLLMGEID